MSSYDSRLHPGPLQESKLCFQRQKTELERSKGGSEEDGQIAATVAVYMAVYPPPPSSTLTHPPHQRPLGWGSNNPKTLQCLSGYPQAVGTHVLKTYLEVGVCERLQGGGSLSGVPRAHLCHEVDRVGGGRRYEFRKRGGLEDREPELHGCRQLYALRPGGFCRRAQHGTYLVDLVRLWGCGRA